MLVYLLQNSKMSLFITGELKVAMILFVVETLIQFLLNSYVYAIKISKFYHLNQLLIVFVLDKSLCAKKWKQIDTPLNRATRNKRKDKNTDAINCL